MAYSTNQFKNGLKILLNGDPCSIIEKEFHKPGKGGAYMKIKYRNLKNGRVLEKTFKSGESVEGADVVETDMQYLYNDGNHYHFMEPTTYEQHLCSKAIVEDAMQWMKEEDLATITLWNGSIISVEASKFVELTVTETQPAVRGDTVTGAAKNATVETGAEIKVPLFIENGDLVKIDTRTGEYISRVKD